MVLDLNLPLLVRGIHFLLGYSGGMEEVAEVSAIHEQINQTNYFFGIIIAHDHNLCATRK
jgi:hypothetical protein